jgi:streptomycin 6-kinase
VVEVPAVVRNKAVAGGQSAWLDGLAAAVEELEGRWAMRVGRVYPDATEALVAEAVLDDGSPAVLKLIVPRGGDAAAHEITVLRLAGGEGCVRLLRDDVAMGALLLERLGPSLHDLAVPVARRHEILCSSAMTVWRPAAGHGLPTGAEKGRRLVRDITALWEEPGHPCSAAAVEHALACAERRIAAHDDERAVLVHGDVHEWNTLRSDDGTFKLVDPDGLLAEAEYDLGVMMREDPLELMADADPRARARWLAHRCGGLDADAVWEWGVVERVSTGLLGAKVGLQPVAGEMLRAADFIARAGG